MKEQTAKKAYIIWTVLNALWWIASIVAGYGYGADLNPLLSNGGEIVLNAVIFLVGLLIIMILTEHDQEEKDAEIVKEEQTEDDNSSN